MYGWGPHNTRSCVKGSQLRKAESHGPREIFKEMRANYIFYNKSNIELGLSKHAKLLNKEWTFGLNGYTKGLVKTFSGC